MRPGLSPSPRRSRHVLQFRELLLRDGDADGTRLPRLPAHQTQLVQLDDHRMNRGRRQPEERPQVEFGRSLPMQLRVPVDERQELPLAVRKRRTASPLLPGAGYATARTGRRCGLASRSPCVPGTGVRPLPGRYPPRRPSNQQCPAPAGPNPGSGRGRTASWTARHSGGPSDRPSTAIRWAAECTARRTRSAADPSRGPAHGTEGDVFVLVLLLPHLTQQFPEPLAQ